MGSAGIWGHSADISVTWPYEETTCLQTCGLIYAPYGPTGHLFSWNTGLLGCVYKMAAGLLGVGIQGAQVSGWAVPFLLMAFSLVPFFWLTFQLAHFRRHDWCHLWNTPRPRSPPGRPVALSGSSTSCPFPAGQLITWAQCLPWTTWTLCLSAVQATNVSSQVFLWLAATCSSVDSAWRRLAWGLPGSWEALSSFLSSSRDFNNEEWTPSHRPSRPLLRHQQPLATSSQPHHLLHHTRSL